MANAKHNKVIIVDTAGAGDIYAQTIPLVINKIRWVGATSAGDQCIIADANDNVFWESVSSGENYAECDDFSTHGDRESNRTLAGLTVPTLDSGKLYIYLD